MLCKGRDWSTIVLRNIDFSQFDFEEHAAFFFSFVADITKTNQQLFKRVVFENCLIGRLDFASAKLLPRCDIFGGRIEELIFGNVSALHPFKSLRVAHASIAYLGSRVQEGDFQASLDFIACEIKNVQVQNVNFLGKVAFYKCRLGHSANGESINFNRCRFSSSTRFKETFFVKAPSFFGADMHGDTDFSNSSFADVSSVRAWRAYRTLKHHVMKFESDHEAQMFHALELEARYNTELPKGLAILADPKGVETIASWFMRSFNSYGRHLGLPLIWLLYIAAWFLVLYAMMGGVGYFPAPKGSVPGWIENAGVHYSNITFTVRNFFGPFGLILSADEIQPNNMAVKSLGVLHFLISSIIWFIWILQIRSRFKL